MTSLELALFGGVRDLLLQLLSFQQGKLVCHLVGSYVHHLCCLGLLFLCSEPEVLNAISRALIQPLVGLMQPLVDPYLVGPIQHW